MIDFLPDAEQEQIIDAVATVLAERFPLARHRPQGQGGKVAPEVWSEIAELGWFGLGLSESLGGVGYSVREDLLMVREFGRQLAPMSLIGSMIGARIAAQCGDAAMLKGILSGESKVALSMPMTAAARTQPAVAVDTASINGRWLVIDAPGADYLAGWSEGCAFLLPSGSQSSCEVQHSLDWTANTSIMEFAAATPRLACAPGDIARLASLLCAALLVGIAEATRDMAVAYAKQRQQFGQPIGAFQSIKHLCADMALRCEMAGSQLLQAGVGEHEKAADKAFHASAAKLLASTAALQNATTNIQIHGGMGYTAECDAHLYLKRAHLVDQLGGAQRKHQELLARAPLGERAQLNMEA